MFNLIGIAGLLTLSALGTWLATGAHPYTKYQDVTLEELAVDTDDPFAKTGFYDGDRVTKTLTTEVFYFGLLPTPQGLFDKHAVSVTSVVLPVRAIVGGIAVVRWRSTKVVGRNRRAKDTTVAPPLLHSSDPSQS